MAQGPRQVLHGVANCARRSSVEGLMTIASRERLPDPRKCAPEGARIGHRRPAVVRELQQRAWVQSTGRACSAFSC